VSWPSGQTVIVDEAYLEFGLTRAKDRVELTRSGANVVVFRTFGKIYGLAGMPIGYAVCTGKRLPLL